ncbi:Carbohydrate sulfotransferase 9 [Portunus trituberculatus]|uniref:Carbohydrate sulfotransferase n=1 Tax=Portunus trituberculatus TaxID=210409 RepID=A0A5B7H692_PORTR|nr:Carbohydrate sulfotransferase 9 [Portunus trituberculatus]
MPSPDLNCESHIRIDVGSSSFRRVYQELKDLIPATHQPVEVMMVRHPLARLTSAYRDKFLDGNQLHKYNDEWRNITQSKDSWGTRFVKFWLPALISTGTLTQTAEFKEMLHKIREAYHRCTSHYVGQTEGILWRPSVQEKKIYGEQVMNTVYNMLHIGPYIGVINACMNTYSLTNAMEMCQNASFTFSQFLRHVVWTHEQGMPDVHWMTYTENCDPCRRRPDYILKLETVQEEINHLFHHVLGFGKKIILPVQHRSVGHSLDHTDSHYYANVSPKLMQRILHIYRHDFALFGYKHDVY